MNKPTRTSRLLFKKIPLFGLSVFTLYIAIYVLAGRTDQLTADFFGPFLTAGEDSLSMEDGFFPTDSTGRFTLSALPNHPKPLLSSFVAAPSRQPLLPDFYALLDQYRVRQSEDDNFTIRVIDKRDNSLLEVFVLESERNEYERTGRMDWKALDKTRRTLTRELSQKHQDEGIPKKAISIKWGRANQVHEARQRELPYIEYELRLAHFHGLSLLATEVGTVETFNEDHLISAVGAKSRYQMMPSMLRKHGIHSYHLTTSGNRTVVVQEEQHPLLSMVPAFFIMRGYSNTVGHEMPGISAYHTGPGNIFAVYRIFLENNAASLSASSHVVDAFLWGLTDGFSKVAENSTFRNHSRGYIPSTYGSLRATEDTPIDTSKTVRAEQVQLRPGQVVYLSELVRYLEVPGTHLQWGPYADSSTTYAKFRALNPHWSLPYTEENLFLPPEADVKIVSTSKERPVRFFLPKGASQALLEQGHTFLDQTKRVVFDESIFAPPTESDILDSDRAYAALVEDIGRFGFTDSNLRALDQIVESFEQQAATDPSFFRQTQRDVAKLHAAMWHSKPWTKLAVGLRRALRQSAAN